MERIDALLMQVERIHHEGRPDLFRVGRKKYTDEEQYALLKYITLRANRGGNVKIAAYGVENIPEENGFMFFPNHQGLYDVLAIIEACPKPFAVVAKKEIANIQFLKQVFACMKAYMLDREDVRQAMQVIIHVTEEVKKGRNYLIFAEGTRSKNGNHPGEFKGGSFKSATKAKWRTCSFPACIRWIRTISPC